jgi:hypothetical protein
MDAGAEMSRAELAHGVANDRRLAVECEADIQPPHPLTPQTMAAERGGRRDGIGMANM